MADHSTIEWTDATWNPIRGCSRVSEGCRNCYAERVAARFSDIGQPYHGLARRVTVTKDTGAALPEVVSEPRWTGDVRFIPELLSQPARWRRPRKIFVNSMSDLFHPSVAIESLDQIFAVMALCPRHTFQVLTKRPQRMLEYMVRDRAWDGPISASFKLEKMGLVNSFVRDGSGAWWPPANVWLGVSVEDQKTADERIPLLLQTPAAVRWVSYEPALGPVDFHRISEIDHGDGTRTGFDPLFAGAPKLNWIVAGGESGPGARPSHPEWFRVVRDQCRAAGVPFFFKQWGEWLHLSQVPAVLTERERELLTFRALPVTNGRSVEYLRIGKKRAGALLDGVAYREFPACLY